MTTHKLLEQAVVDGLMSAEDAQRADAWAEALAKAQVCGVITPAGVQAQIRERAQRDARAYLRRRCKP